MTNKNSSTGVAPRCQFHFSDGRCCRMLRLTPARLTGRRESGQFHVSVTAFGRSRPAADASREVVERWLLDGLM